NKRSIFAVAIRMAPYVNREPAGDSARLRSALIRWASAGYLRAARGHIGIRRNIAAFAMRWLYQATMTFGYWTLRRPSRFSSPFSLRMNRKGT
ncbi:hypothetical protein ACPWML_25065, partial [Pandoraea pneumonica]